MSTTLWWPCGLVANWLGRWNCDSKGRAYDSRPSAFRRGDNLGQVVHTRASVTKRYNLVKGKVNGMTHFTLPLRLFVCQSVSLSERLRYTFSINV